MQDQTGFYAVFFLFSSKVLASLGVKLCVQYFIYSFTLMPSLPFFQSCRFNSLAEKVDKKMGVESLHATLCRSFINFFTQLCVGLLLDLHKVARKLSTPIFSSTFSARLLKRRLWKKGEWWHQSKGVKKKYRAQSFTPRDARICKEKRKKNLWKPVGPCVYVRAACCSSLDSLSLTLENWDPMPKAIVLSFDKHDWKSQKFHRKKFFFFS